MSMVVAASTAVRPCRQQAKTAWGETSLKLARQARRQRHLVCKSTGEPGPSPPESEQPAATPPPPAEAPAAGAPGLKPGQGTAIVTGAISIIFGVLYLALVQFMEMRGGELLPPPPEAFGP